MNVQADNTMQPQHGPTANHLQPRRRRALPASHAHRIRLALACALLLGTTGPATADAVTDWNAVANQNTTLPLPVKLRAMAIVQIAVHDALNHIDARFETYTVQHAANPHALPHIAVASAASTALLAVAPADRHATISAAYDGVLAATPECQHPRAAACLSAIVIGNNAAGAILRKRRGDGSEASNWHRPYTLDAAAGVHQPTPDTVPTIPVFAGWATVAPFAMDSATQFRAPYDPILDVTGSAYAADYQEVLEDGSKVVRAAAPDSELSRIARFWYGSAGHDWAALAQAATGGVALDLWENARLYALLAIGQADVTISVFEAKYHYSFWRPVTAIRWADDGNPDTVADPAWTPYLVTPPYPDYPCGTPMLAGAGTETLRTLLGTDALAWSAVSNFPGQPGVPAGAVGRDFATFSATADEVAQARVYAGIHFGRGCHVGVDQGEKIARYAIDTLLRPL